MELDHNASPINPLPGVVWLLALPIVVIELLLSGGDAGLIGGPAAIGWRLQTVQDYAFSVTILDWMRQNDVFPADQMIRFVSYMFVHGTPTHAIFVTVFILALGKFVGEVFAWWAVIVVFLVSGLAGSIAYGFLAFTPIPLLGGYPPVYGLIGAFSYILWSQLGQTGQSRYRAFSLISFLLGFQMLFGLLFGGGREWIADIAGFATGFALSFVVSPGGIARTLDMIRQR